LEAALTVNANAAAMTSTNFGNEPNSSAIIVINNPPLPAYDDIVKK